MKIVVSSGMKGKTEIQGDSANSFGNGSDEQVFDVIVIGAGSAGLMGALEIALTGKRVVVIEATSRVGGRILTVNEGGIPVELGAEFIHGNLPLTQMLLKKAGAKTYKVEGNIWQYKEGTLAQQEDFIEDYNELEKSFSQLTSDKSVAAFLAEDLAGDKYDQLRFSLKNYVEGYYAADTEKASTKALCEELTKGDEEQYRIEGGYQCLIDYLEQECRKKGVVFQIDSPVIRIHWMKDAVKVVTSKGNYTGRKVLIAVPMGVLQNESIQFLPALPQVTTAVKQLGFGHVIKLVLCFEKSFWKYNSLTNGKDLRKLSFLFSEEDIPTWWTHHPNDDAMLTGWVGGPAAKALQNLSMKTYRQRLLRHSAASSI
jgi:monoamine oxidase